MGNPTRHYKDDQYSGHRVAAPHLEIHQHMNPVTAVLCAVPLYIWNFAPHPLRPAPGATGAGAMVSRVLDLFLWAFLLVLEMIGAVIKPFALSIRLFANMIAGHIVLGSLLLLIPLGSAFVHQLGVGAPITVLSLMIRMLELFVCFLQAYIFVFLVTLFIGSAVAPEH
jgi:F-type H+-transporting ATPase subunit a